MIEVVKANEDFLRDRLREREEVLRIITENSEADVRAEINEIRFLLGEREGSEDEQRG